jgi:hypothetical protein
MDRLFAAVDRAKRAEAAEPHAHADDEAEYATELVALAARDVVREVEAGNLSKPVGWDDDPVHGKPDDPNWAAHREHTCGKCGETFGSNFQPGEVDCPECDARLCSSCGHWEGGSE